MELSWSTFLLEIINFLVLVWILKHFLYRPVLDVIARRHDSIEAQIAEAKGLHEEAENLKADYENRLSEWEEERQRLRDRLAQEIDKERVRQMAALQTTLFDEQKKARVAMSRQREEEQRGTEQRAMQQAAGFANRLLAEAAGPELEARLTTMLLDGLANLSAEKLGALKGQWGEPPASIQVSSAYEIPEQQRQQLDKALTGISGLNVPVKYELDSSLMAGLRISIGAWVLHANLKDELKGFTEFVHVAR